MEILIGIASNLWLTLGNLGISLMTNDFKHLFMCFLAICISSLDVFLLRPFAQFLIGIFVFPVLSLKCFVLYILDTSPLLDIEKHFLPFCGSCQKRTRRLLLQIKQVKRETEVRTINCITRCKRI